MKDSFVSKKNLSTSSLYKSGLLSKFYQNFKQEPEFSFLGNYPISFFSGNRAYLDFEEVLLKTQNELNSLNSDEIEHNILSSISVLEDPITKKRRYRLAIFDVRDKSMLVQDISEQYLINNFAKYFNQKSQKQCVDYISEIYENFKSYAVITIGQSSKEYIKTRFADLGISNKEGLENLLNLTEQPATIYEHEKDSSCTMKRFSDKIKDKHTFSATFISDKNGNFNEDTLYIDIRKMVDGKMKSIGHIKAKINDNGDFEFIKSANGSKLLYDFDKLDIKGMPTSRIPDKNEEDIIKNTNIKVIVARQNRENDNISVTSTISYEGLDVCSQKHNVDYRLATKHLNNSDQLDIEFGKENDKNEGLLNDKKPNNSVKQPSAQNVKNNQNIGRF